MRRFLPLLTLLLGVTLLAAEPASAAVAAQAENRASGSVTDPGHRISTKARLSAEAIRKNAALAYDFASDSPVAAKAGGRLPANLYHYTGAGNAESILQNGLGAGGRRTFATPAGNLSPVQAQIELALPANRGYPGALFEINTARLQQLGINPAVGPHRIMSTPNAGGGGIELIFNQPIPPSAIRQVPFP